MKVTLWDIQVRVWAAKKKKTKKKNVFVRNFFCPETRRITFESRMHMDFTSGAISFKKYIYISNQMLSFDQSVFLIRILALL